MDTKGLLVTVKVTPADVSDRDAARALLPGLRKRNPALTLMWADNAYTGLADRARDELHITFKVVKKPPGQVGFTVLPRRWIVERSLSWLMRRAPWRSLATAPCPASTIGAGARVRPRRAAMVYVPPGSVRPMARTA